MFINFKMAHLCSSPQKHLFLISISPKTLPSNSAQMSAQVSAWVSMHSMEVMVYQYDKLFGYGWWMTSIRIESSHEIYAVVAFIVDSSKN